MQQHIIYIGLDVHKDTIAAVFPWAGKRGEVRKHRKVLNNLSSLSRA
jgi:transposase